MNNNKDDKYRPYHCNPDVFDRKHNIFAAQYVKLTIG